MEPKKPNLLFIFSDQHRKFDLGCYGNCEVMTPNLDALASVGLRFEHCCSNSPVCVPARGSLLTGVHAQTHGAFTNDLPIRYDLESIADVLNRAGYHTGYIGKWHLCGVPRDQYVDRARRLGFTEWKVANCNHDYLNCYYDDEENLRHRPGGYEPEIFGGLAEEFLQRNSRSDRPFALFLSFATPHDSHTAVGEEYKEIYREKQVTLRPNATETIMFNLKKSITHAQQAEYTRGYYGHITAIDRQVGKLLTGLRENGALDHTLVIYTADHGDMLGSQGLRDKQLPYEESIGVPLIAAWKGHISAGVSTQMISLVDLPVTVAGLLGLQFTQPKDGLDCSALFKGGKAVQQQCYLYDLYPCHQAADKGLRAWRGLRTQQYTYAVHGDGTDWLLFDNDADPYQQHNLVKDAAYAQVRKELKAVLDNYVLQQDAYLEGEDYIRFADRQADFDQSQTYFGRPTLQEIENSRKPSDLPE